MNSSKKYIIIGLVVVIVVALVVLLLPTVKKELGLSSKAGVSYNKLSISEEELDADLKALKDNKPLNKLFDDAQDPLVKDGQVAPTYRASWVNLKMRTLAIKEIRLKNKLEITDKDKKEATKDAKELFSGNDASAAKDIWKAFPKSFQNRLIASFAEQHALMRTAPKVTDKQIKTFFNDNQDKIAPACESGKSISHILVENEADAKKIKARLANGEDFADLASELSTDPGSKDKGGDLGCFTQGSYVPEFEAAAIALSVGKTSEIVKTDFGYHILKAQAYSSPTLEESREQIVSQLEQENQSKVFEKVKESLKDAKVKVLKKYGRVKVEDGIPSIVPLEADVPETTVPQSDSVPTT